MSLAQRKAFLTPAEYLRIERDAPYRSEYFNGEMFAKAGGSPRHSLIKANLVGELGNCLKGRPYTAYDTDLRIRVVATGLYTYADASVICDPLELDENDPHTAVNPTVLAEVLSDATEAYDRGKRFDHYRKIPSLKEYLLVSQETPKIERFARNPNGTWVLTIVEGLEQALELPALGVTIRLAEIYDKVDCATPSADSAAASS